MRIASLDGIRAISFALVFAGHAGFNSIVPTTFGVTVFFFLSGYLITTLLRVEKHSTGTISLKDFYLRRMLRILPPFYVAFGLACALWGLGLVPPPGELQSLAAVLLHFSNYYIVQHDNQGFLNGTGVYWSLAVEEHFYLLFPCFFLLVSRIFSTNRPRALTMFVLCIILLAWRSILVIVGHAPELRTSVASDTRFDSLLFGCMLALVENPAVDTSVLSQRAWKLLFPVGLIGLLVSFVVRNDVFRETIRYDLQALSLIPIFVCAVRYPRWFPIRPLNFRPIAFVGVLSYSLYLIHLIVLGAWGSNLGSQMGPLPVALLSLITSLALAVLIHEFIEKPAMMLRRRLQAVRRVPAMASLRVSQNLAIAPE
jgi:peptidoglycan/LPS O-acetylase OafA/YrhL